jgi:hypothetical protein
MKPRDTNPKDPSSQRIHILIPSAKRHKIALVLFVVDAFGPKPLVEFGNCAAECILG